MNEDTPRPSLRPALPEFSVKRFSTILKMAAIAILALLLLIPLAMVDAVLRERLARRDAAVSEIAATWGSQQVIAGPVLIVPYRYTQKSWTDQAVDGRVTRVETAESVRGRACFLPAALSIDGRLDPDRLHRGIYETVVYSGTLKVSGSFAKPSFDEWGVDPGMVLWNEAEIAMSVTDLRGARESVQVRLAGQPYSLTPGHPLKAFDSGISARVKGLDPSLETIPFDMALTLKGSRGLRVAPVGVNNDVRIASSWPDPSFQGAFLPAEREVGPDGFAAHWRVSYYGRSYPQQWTEQNAFDAKSVASSLFGVDLLPALDSYRHVERAIKYGILVIALVFTAFFLFEVLAPVRVHPFQYTLVGFALCLFYLGLLALSEVTSFATAYWSGAAASSLMIALYSAKVLESSGRAFAVAAGLAAVYAFLYVILRLQDLSLLVGTAGLFLVLAAVMYLTRNIDWYARDRE
jgi:inner membrane protein